jgi:hypothetical protein
MKLNKTHLFVILLLALIFSSTLGIFVKENMVNHKTETSDEVTKHQLEDEKAPKVKNLAGDIVAITSDSASPPTVGDAAQYRPPYESQDGGQGGQYDTSLLETGGGALTQPVSQSYNDMGSNIFSASPLDVDSSGQPSQQPQPQGISQNQIPSGDEDLYILKSQIVPPVCPACPAVNACPRQAKCPPCPSCKRCPEPAYECKKVPNYNAAAQGKIPKPVLNDFSQFGM